MTTLLRTTVVLGTLLPSFGWVSLLAAADFRVDNQVYSDTEESSTLVAENSTYFVGGVVYDIQTNPAGYTIFDPETGHFTLLDAQKQWKTYIDRETLLKFIAMMQERAARGAPLHRFAADPQFRVEYSGTDRALTLSADLITYRTKNEKLNPDVTQQYSRFADWYARLNATHVGALPPMPRLELNRQLAERSLTPVEVHLRIAVRGRPATMLHSTHRYSLEPLTADEKALIERVRRAADEYKEVSFTEFRGIDEKEAVARR